MAVAATKSVTGFVTNLSAAEIDGAVLHLNLNPTYAGVGDTIIVGEQDADVVGELVTPVSADGSFAVDVVAVDDPEWTITVTVDGPNVEQPAPTFEMWPPPAAGTGDVGIGSLLLSSTGGGTDPVTDGVVRLQTLRDVQVNNLTDGDGLFWSASAQKFVNEQPTGGTGGGVTEAELTAGLATKVDTDDSRLNDARTPTAHAASHATGGSDAVSAASIGAMTQTAADGRYAATTGVLMVARNTDDTWSDRPTAGVVVWLEMNPSSPLCPDGMIDGDFYDGPDGMTGVAPGGTP